MIRKPSDLVIIVTYGLYDESESMNHCPKVFLVDKQNRIAPT